MTAKITNEVRAETVEKLERARTVFAAELDLLACLDGHWVTEVGNLGYYRSDVHCSCAAEWWAGDHEGDPSYADMWDLHRAEVIAGFLADRQSS
jgi:hypothetical protein